MASRSKDSSNKKWNIGGGEVVVSASYADDQTDFGEVIKGMVRYKKSRDPKEDPKPIINFEAMFIPDDVLRLNLVT